MIFDAQKFVILMKSSLSAFSLIVLLISYLRNHRLIQGLICSWALIYKGNLVMTQRPMLLKEEFITYSFPKRRGHAMPCRATWRKYIKVWLEEAERSKGKA